MKNLILLSLLFSLNTLAGEYIVEFEILQKYGCSKPSSVKLKLDGIVKNDGFYDDVNCWGKVKNLQNGETETQIIKGSNKIGEKLFAVCTMDRFKAEQCTNTMTEAEINHWLLKGSQK